MQQALAIRAFYDKLFAIIKIQLILSALLLFRQAKRMRYLILSKLLIGVKDTKVLRKGKGK